MSESCNQYGDNGDDSQYRCADPAEGCTQLSEDAGAALHGYHQFLDALCSARVSLHALTHGGYYRTKDYEEGAEGCDHQSDGYDGFPLRFIHVVQLIYKSLHSGDDLADYGHQHFAKRNGQLFQLAFEDRELSVQVILHDSCHVFSRSVTVLDGVAQLVNVSGCRVHEGKEATHGVLANERFRCRCCLRFRHLRKGSSAVCQNI